MNYLENTRHPWSCFLFVMPLLWPMKANTWQAGPHPPWDATAAETWLRLGLANLGFTTDYAAPALVIGILIVWSFPAPPG